jgi:hypothetical protein
MAETRSLMEFLQAGVVPDVLDLGSDDSVLPEGA